jgi:hypothetical protein
MDSTCKPISRSAIAACLAILVAHASASAAVPAPKAQAVNLGQWYTVTCPDVFLIGTEAEIKVAYRGIAEKTTLCCDLHYQKTDGSAGGFYSNDWRPKPPVQGQGLMTFRIPVRDAADVASAMLVIFTAPDGQWARNSRLVYSRPIPVVDPDPGYNKYLRDVKYNKSWIAIDWGPLAGPLVEGDKIEIPVEYYLDPAEHYRAATLSIEALGPRVPKPDARQPVSFENTQHLWYGAQSVKVEPGRGKHLFPLTVPKASSQNDLLLLAFFSDGRGKRWPWDTRAGAWFARKGGYFELETDKPGNLFTRGEPVRIVARLKNARPASGKKALKYKVYDYTRALVAQGSVPFTVERDGQKVPVGLDLARLGTFLFQAEVEGWEARETAFCRIPDLAAITGGKPTRLGFTVHAVPRSGFRTSQMIEAARRLGLTNCRVFTEWKSIEPGPKHYALQHWDRFFEAAHRNGIESIVTIYDPPAWVMPKGQSVGYQMFDCDLDAFREMVTTVSTRYKGKLGGWEWLNEITPGGPPDYVADYAKLCRAGAEASRAVDPGLRSVVAGGLWPRGFRLEVLNAGAGKYVDALPIHYGNGAGIREAREDLDAYGCPRAGVWENESCAFVIQWDCPGLEWISETVKCKWVLSQWADELAAGCEKLIYFGGEGAATGYGDYLRADFTPLPVAATLAVLAAKTFDAKPVGVFSSAGKRARFQLFERDGKAILIASSSVEAGEEVPLAVGTQSVRVTDYQGNETTLPAAGGVARLPLAPLGCFVEGADLDVLKTCLVPAIDVPSAGGDGNLGGGTPQIALRAGKSDAVRIRLRNPYARPLGGTLRLDLPESWLSQREISFSLQPGEQKIVTARVTVPRSSPLAAFPHQLRVAFDWPKLPAVSKPFVVSVISPESVGNLLRNGDFEQVEADGKTPKYWRGTNAQLVSSEGLGPGLGKHVLRFSGASSWANYGQSVALRGGTTYLYTAWIWNQGMEGGSNIDQTMTDGSTRSLYNMDVINIGNSTPSWQVFTCRYQAPENLATAGFVAVARGGGAALYDNMRVTTFEGTDFAAEAVKVRRPPAIDGKLDDSDGACPIPLIGRNQLHALVKDYQWTPKNLSGAAYLRWDERNLYVTVDVRDDVHFAAGDGDTVIDGDSLILAFDPARGSPDAAGRSCAYYVSSQKPAGGSGRHTLWRPAQHSAGRPAGHLARDSSLYEIAVKPEGGRCVYELRIPWSELGFSPAFGAKFGFSIQLNDNDGHGPAARMNWGGGISPAWHPASFGVVTLVE